MKQGVILGICTYAFWGLFPIYWKALDSLPSLEILGHRIVWSIVWLALLITIVRGWPRVMKAVRNRALLSSLALASLLLSINWFVYIWAVNNDFVIETSLGYFINPLISVMLGVVFLGERLRPAQIAAVLLAASGVLYLTFVYGQPPWISLTLAISFAFYGLIKKQTGLPAAEGLFIETFLVFGFAFAYLIALEVNGRAAFGHASLGTNLLLIFAGVATALPLVTFAAAAKRIPLSMIGFLQYIAPSIQFFLGIFLYHEPFSQTRLIGFCLIWSALAVFTVDGLTGSRGAFANAAQRT